MFEVELKVWVTDFEKLSSYLSEKFINSERIEVEDIYLEHPCFNLVEREEELRIRHDKTKKIFSLTFKSPIKKGDRVVRLEQEVTVKEKEVIDIFRNLGFKEKLRKVKKGWRFYKNNLKLDLVEVSGEVNGKFAKLGSFLEIEISISREEDISRAKEEIMYFIKQLPFVGSIENRFYAEMLVEKAFKKEKN